MQRFRRRYADHAAGAPKMSAERMPFSAVASACATASTRRNAAPVNRRRRTHSARGAAERSADAQQRAVVDNVLTCRLQTKLSNEQTYHRRQIEPTSPGEAASAALNDTPAAQRSSRLVRLRRGSSQICCRCRRRRWQQRWRACRQQAQNSQQQQAQEVQRLPCHLPLLIPTSVACAAARARPRSADARMSFFVPMHSAAHSSARCARR